MANYTNSGLKFSGNKYYRQMNPNLKILLQIVVAMYDGGQGRVKVSVHSQL